MLSYHSELGLPYTCSTKREFSLPPSGEQDGSFPHPGSASPRLSAECAEHTRARRRRPTPLDCHTPCPDIGAVASVPSAGAASPRWRPGSLPEPWYRARLPQPQLQPEDHRQPQPAGFASRRFSRGLWDSDQQGPPQTGLAHSCIGRLPLPVHTTEFFGVLDQSCPDAIEDTQLRPALKGTMNRAIVGILLRQLVPLAVTWQPKGEAIECSSLVNSLAAHMLATVVLVQYRFDLVPQVVWCVPDRWHHRGIPFSSGHDAPPALSGARSMPDLR